MQAYSKADCLNPSSGINQRQAPQEESGESKTKKWVVLYIDVTKAGAPKHTNTPKAVDRCRKQMGMKAKRTHPRRSYFATLLLLQQQQHYYCCKTGTASFPLTTSTSTTSTSTTATATAKTGPYHPPTQYTFDISCRSSASMAVSSLSLTSRCKGLSPVLLLGPDPPPPLTPAAVSTSPPPLPSSPPPAAGWRKTRASESPVSE